MEVIVNERNYLEEEILNLIIKTIEKLSKIKKEIVFGIPGGNSVQNIFLKLKEKNINWEKIHIFMVDERMVEITHKDSNYNLAYKTFIKELLENGKIPKENIHFYDFKKSVSEYESELKKYGGKFDIVLLGVGEDGHIAGLFPNLSINNQEDYFITFDNSPKPPKERMSASRKLLEKSGLGLFLFFGDLKKQAYIDFNDSNKNVAECPAKIAYNLKESYIFTDIRRE